LYKRHRFPSSLIQSVVFFYHPYALSLREGEELMLIRGIDVSYETIRTWSLKFGPTYKKALRSYQSPASDKWHLDEVGLRIQGKYYWLWRALDDQDQEIDILLQPRRNAKAAKRFFLKLLGKEGFLPRVIITDKLASYKAGLRKLGLFPDHRKHKSLNNRMEGSHQHVRRQEKIKRRFRNVINCQKFLSLSLTISTCFGRVAHKLGAADKRAYKHQALNNWHKSTQIQDNLA
jgi:putative transposase